MHFHGLGMMFCCLDSDTQSPGGSNSNEMIIRQISYDHFVQCVQAELYHCTS